MALIQFGKKEIEALEKANQKLIQELGKEKALGEKLNALLISKEKEIDELQQQLRDIEKVKIDDQKLEKIINTSNKNSKATIENIDIIRKLKEEGHSFRSIAKALSEATGTPFAHSTVRYLYNKYIK
ncbi:MAG: hypothetical protein N4A57_01145 [Anaeromicrobium sp.]|jgi:benzoyl-CoA reductase/2-hydroxyglutaryl-CoA dehydratase subunit BcrC/BadD/HgdB|uniref:hypothetical protein n=1 Tax=Anaeromicrobium sp. TaxID=1929132 RepID=UPI0025ED7624|nr:hypothetical protein [Anaeromicrobium sp.]MCT4592871.1 hypothetical protein [Anaeromicrobium sp.]